MESDGGSMRCVPDDVDQVKGKKIQRQFAIKYFGEDSEDDSQYLLQRKKIQQKKRMLKKFKNYFGEDSEDDTQYLQQCQTKKQKKRMLKKFREYFGEDSEEDTKYLQIDVPRIKQRKKKKKQQVSLKIQSRHRLILNKPVKASSICTDKYFGEDSEDDSPYLLQRQKNKQKKRMLKKFREYFGEDSEDDSPYCRQRQKKKQKKRMLKKFGEYFGEDSEEDTKYLQIDVPRIKQRKKKKQQVSLKIQSRQRLILNKPVKASSICTDVKTKS
ncbi:hypothetical protein TSAR_009463 [Trichomalopsis sarcophagae]|uniref:Elongation factor 1 beta central acidic region eukaryote domain-containing protein n=1 Tax=Trichomalopsis sarcophagae TaxID=543379 RepID=A0A232FMC1_9HYME|nr:hypothetical protein TSAR_009463 [Trichomalopsis sarcophagae]